MEVDSWLAVGRTRLEEARIAVGTAEEEVKIEELGREHHFAAAEDNIGSDGIGSSHLVARPSCQRFRSQS